MEPVLRALGCALPIEVWYRGRREMTRAMLGLLESVEGVRCVDALGVLVDGRPRQFVGWDLKPFAIIHSRFEQVYRTLTTGGGAGTLAHLGEHQLDH